MFIFGDRYEQHMISFILGHYELFRHPDFLASKSLQFIVLSLTRAGLWAAMVLLWWWQMLLSHGVCSGDGR